METLLVKINEASKTPMLIEILRSMDFIDSVDYLDDVQKTRQLFEEVNQIASETELSQLSMNDITAEIKKHRLEKKSDRN